MSRLRTAFTTCISSWARGERLRSGWKVQRQAAAGSRDLLDRWRWARPAADDRRRAPARTAAGSEYIGSRAMVARCPEGLSAHIRSAPTMDQSDAHMRARISKCMLLICAKGVDRRIALCTVHVISTKSVHRTVNSKGEVAMLDYRLHYADPGGRGPRSWPRDHVASQNRGIRRVFRVGGSRPSMPRDGTPLGHGSRRHLHLPRLRGRAASSRGSTAAAAAPPWKASSASVASAG